MKLIMLNKCDNCDLRLQSYFLELEYFLIPFSHMEFAFFFEKPENRTCSSKCSTLKVFERIESGTFRGKST